VKIEVGRALLAALVLGLAGGGQAWADGVEAETPGTGSIVNGIPTNLQPTTGALLFVGPDTKNQFLDCSVVLIGCRTALTAAHCICKDSNNAELCEAREIANLGEEDLRVFFQHSGIHHVRDVFINPEYERGKRGDIAVLRLSEKVTGVEPARANLKDGIAVQHGTEGIIAGFGNSGDDRLDAAIKRVGEVVTDKCPAGIIEPANICWNFIEPIEAPGSEANVCFKDDGGPLFVDFGSGPVVAGIHAGGSDTCEEFAFAYDTNVFKNHQWIMNVGGVDIGREQCSLLNEVGENNVVVKGASGKLPKSEDEARFVFDIPQDTILLRVTVNGDTEREGDYDLFVGLDEAPTKFDNDCQSRGVGQFGVCEIANPDAEKVSVLIKHVFQGQGRGRSRFQVTVTAFGPPPDGLLPPAPRQLRYENRSEILRRFMWLDESFNEEGFQIQRSLGRFTDDFVTRGQVAADKDFFLDSTNPDNIYTYRVRAFNESGFSEWSNDCIVNDPGPTPPNRLRVEEITDNKVVLRWNDRSDDETGFELQRRVAGAKRWRQVAILNADDERHADRSVDGDTAYEYRVRAKGRFVNCIKDSKFSPKLLVSTP